MIVKRYYIAPLDVLLSNRSLFYSRAGCRYVQLVDGFVLVSAALRNEAAEDHWHANPAVTILPCPVFEGKDSLRLHVSKPNRRLGQAHLNRLASLGVTEGDTVLDMEEKLVRMNKGMRLRSLQ